jgi:TPR repeat protein
MYENGQGVGANIEKTKRWYEKQQNKILNQL